jgi:hypothetical protein
LLPSFLAGTLNPERGAINTNELSSSKMVGAAGLVGSALKRDETADSGSIE